MDEQSSKSQFTCRYYVQVPSESLAVRDQVPKTCTLEALAYGARIRHAMERTITGSNVQSADGRWLGRATTHR